MRRLLVRFRLAALNGVEIGFRHESTGKLAFMGIQGERHMKTIVFITRRGKSFAIAKVISLAARFSTNKVSTSDERKELRDSEGHFTSGSFLNEQKFLETQNQESGERSGNRVNSRVAKWGRL